MNGECCSTAASRDVLGQEAPDAPRASPTTAVDAQQPASTFGPGYVFSGDIKDPWNHAAKFGRQGFACHYCGLKREGGGATRLKDHLAGISGAVVACYNVPSEVQATMRKSRVVFKQNKSQKKARKLRLDIQLLEEMGGTPVVDLDPSDDEERLRLAREKKLRHLKLKQAVESFGGKYEGGSGSASGSVNIDGSPKTPASGNVIKFGQRRSSLSPSGGSTGTASGKTTKTRQTRIDFTCEKKNAAKLGQAWSKWFHANDVAGRKIDCPLFRAALRLSQELEKYMSKVGPRIQYMYDDTLMLAAAVLDPESHYSIGFDKDPYYRNKLLDVIVRMADTPESGAKAMEELVFYSANKGNFAGVMSRIGARTLSPATWWSTYGGDVPTLQKYAMRIVSQCVSSSGCERNWSTFALIHTKLRNRLVTTSYGSWSQSTTTCSSGLSRTRPV